MSTTLLETKLFLPQPRRGLVPRPRLRERLHQGLAAKLMLVSAPAGFGKTTLLVDWMAARLRVTGRRDRHGVAVAGRGRQRPGDVLDLRDRRAADRGTRRRHGRARPAAGTPATALPDRADHPPQRSRRAPTRPGPAARRLPRHRLARGAGRDGLPARPPPPAAPPGDRQSRRPAPAAPPDARTRRPRRGPRGRPALHARRGGGLPQRRHGTAAHPGGRRRPWRGAPRAGSPRSSSPRSRWPGATTSPPSSPASRATTGTSWTTWSRRCCNASRRTSGRSCCRPRFSTA